MPSCFRCQTTNPLLNQNGDRCTACAHPFVRSFASFEPLPLVRFMPERRISQVGLRLRARGTGQG